MPSGPSMLVASSKIPCFLWLHIIPLYIFFNHSPLDGHLDCFHVLAIVNKAAWTFGCMYLFKLVSLAFLDIGPGVGLLDHMVVWFLPPEFPRVAAPIYFGSSIFGKTFKIFAM